MPVRRRDPLLVGLVAFFSLLVAAAPTRAQVAAGEISGLVKGQDGAAVPGASITVTEVQTNRQRVVVSTGDAVSSSVVAVPAAVAVVTAMSSVVVVTAARRFGAQLLRRRHTTRSFTAR